MNTTFLLKSAALLAVPLALVSLASGTASAQDDRILAATECGAGRVLECGERTTFACEWQWKLTPWYWFPYVMYMPHEECVPTTKTTLYKNFARGDDTTDEQ